jgi:hypothetical protein
MTVTDVEAVVWPFDRTPEGLVLIEHVGIAAGAS